MEPKLCVHELESLLIAALHSVSLLEQLRHLQGKENRQAIFDLTSDVLLYPTHATLQDQIDRNCRS